MKTKKPGMRKALTPCLGKYYDCKVVTSWLYRRRCCNKGRRAMCRNATMRRIQEMIGKNMLDTFKREIYKMPLKDLEELKARSFNR